MITEAERETYKNNLRLVCARPVEDRMAYAIERCIVLLREIGMSLLMNTAIGEPASPTAVRMCVLTLKRAAAIVEGNVDEVLRLQDAGIALAPELHEGHKAPVGH